MYDAGLNVLFSGEANEFIFSNEAYDVLIPAITETLMTVQTPYPYPPDPQTYEGLYTTGKVNISISTIKNQLLATVNNQLNVFLAYREPLYLQVSL